MRFKTSWIVLVLLALIATPSLAGEWIEVEEEESPWTLSVGAVYAQNEDEFYEDGAGWAVELDMPIFPGQWTGTIAYSDTGTGLFDVGFRRWAPAGATWFWMGGGLGVADIGYSTTVPSVNAQAGLQWNVGEVLAIKVRLRTIGLYGGSQELVVGETTRPNKGGCYHRCPPTIETHTLEEWNVSADLTAMIGFRF